MDKNDFHFLVVDDDPLFMESLYQIISRKGYQCTRVTKPEDAINLARIKIFHGAFIDCMLPRTNGVKLTEELRKLRFGQSPVVLMSGIFKDKAFAMDAQAKTGAIDFLYKPIDAETVMSHVQGMITLASGIKDHPPLNKLLSGPASTPRAQIKTIESLEKISGFDFAFVLSALLKIRFSGYLNIVSPLKKIIGLTFSKGYLVKYDSEDQFDRIQTLLLQGQYLEQQELDECLESNLKDGSQLLPKLVQMNLLSPHISDLILVEFIMFSISQMFFEEDMEFSLSPSKVEDEAAPQFGLSRLYPLFHEFSMNAVSLNYLKSFYDEWNDFAVRKTPFFQDQHPLFLMPLLKSNWNIVEKLSAEPTVNECRDLFSGQNEEFYRVLHLLTLTDLIRFDDQPQSSKKIDPFEQMKSYQRDLKGKDAQGIFMFFGASDRVLPSEIEPIYREFVKSNHPDRLPKGAKEETRAAVTDVYALVSSAYKVLSDAKLREDFFNQKKQQAATIQIKSEAILEEGLHLLRKGQVSLAIKSLQESYEMHQSDRGLIILRWAEVKKMEQKPDAKRLDQILAELEGVDIDEKRGAFCQLVLGLIYKSKKEYDAAYDHIDRALAVDPSFIDARREMAALSRINKKSTHSDFLTGDLTASITNLFKIKIK